MVRLFLLISVICLGSLGVFGINTPPSFFPHGASFEQKMTLISEARHKDLNTYKTEILPFTDSVMAACYDVTPNQCTRAKMVRSKYYFDSDEFEEFIPLAISLLDQEEHITLRDTMLLFNRLAKAFEHSNVYVESLKYRTKMQQILPHYLSVYPNDVQYITNMSDFFMSQKKYREALVAYKKNLAYLVEHGNTFNQGSLNNSVGVCFNKLNQPDSAIAYFNRARGLYHKYNNFDSAYIDGLIDGNIGQALMKKEQFADAIPYLISDIEGSTKRYKSNATNSYMELVRCYLAVGQDQNAKASLDTLNRYVAAINLKGRQKLDLLMLNAQVYQRVGKSKEAADYLEAYIQFKEQINTAAQIRQTNALLMVYDLDEKQQIITEQKRVNEQTQHDLEDKKLQQLLVWGIMLVVAVVLVIVLIANKKVNDQKVALEKQVVITNDALVQKEVLLKEIHHRVKNNLQIMSGLMHLQAANTDHQWMKDYMQEGQQRIDSMTLIHNMLYQTNQQLNQVDLGAYFNELMDQLRLSFQIPTSIQMINTVEHLHVSVDIAVPMGLIINELITNSVKYAFPEGRGQISLRLIGSETENGYTIEYVDNGVGFNPDQVNKGGSLGVRLIKMLCEEMDAKLFVSSYHGVCYKFTFG